jgi:acetylornithine/N-succinyldiaminopimelate aminotransferase
MSKPVPPTPPQSPSSAAATRPGPVMATYARRNLEFTRGEGPWLFTATGEQYLDCGSGIAVTALGHTHPRLVKVLHEQADKLWHTSNLYPIGPQDALAKRLVEASFADTAFFCNSGAEAVEGAIKAARRYHFANGAPERWRIITFEGAFHGRTLATIAAGGNPKYLEGFGPKVDGFDHVPFADHNAVEAAITPETAAIMIEPVQGEGGIRTVPPQCLEGLRALCDENELLLIFDEVQSGMGRTGKLFAHQWSGVTPDIMSLAKGLGGGFPIGAVLATAEAAVGMTAGSHGSTFGGNPMACAVANEVLSIMLEPDFMTSVQSKGLQLKQSLESLKDRHAGLIEEVRGVGLLAGLKLKVPVPDLVTAAESQKLLLVGAGDNVVRILPPLTISQEQLADAMSRLDHALSALKP